MKLAPDYGFRGAQLFLLVFLWLQAAWNWFHASRRLWYKLLFLSLAGVGVISVGVMGFTLPFVWQEGKWLPFLVSLGVYLGGYVAFLILVKVMHRN